MSETWLYRALGPFVLLPGVTVVLCMLQVLGVIDWPLWALASPMWAPLAAAALIAFVQAASSLVCLILARLNR